MSNNAVNATLAAAQRETMGAGAEAGGSELPSKLTHTALDAAAEAAEAKSQHSLERAAARADADTKRRVG